MMPKFLLYISYKYGFPIVRPLQEEILKRGYEVAWFVEIEENKSFLEPNERLLTTVNEVITYRPDIVLVSSNVVPHFFSGIKVQLFHGFSVNKRSLNEGHFKIRGFFDLYCTQGPSTTNYFKDLEKKHGHFKVIETGWSKVDSLFPVEKNKNINPVVFIASTFTERLSLAHNNEIFNTIVELINENNWKFIINLHPKMDGIIKQKFENLNKFENVTYIPFLKNLEPLKKADVMFTDTSSIITEFIIQNKPVVTFNNSKPKDCFININKVRDIKSSIERALDRPNDLMKKIEEFVLDEHPYFDGSSSKRVIDATVKFHKENRVVLLKAKPINLVRKYKICKQLKYYKF